ncbi:MAG TPA: hypothetical protein VMV38_02245 [Candidatus Paceibacterota bacterium]|nr:hypothetical protein [Candidatus Paceibacterota bacterium]
MKNMIQKGMIAIAICSFGLAGTAFATNPAHVDINVGVVTQNVDQDARAAALAGDYATATATAANGIASVTNNLDENIAMNVGVVTNNVDQDAGALALSFEGSNATATAANAIASLSTDPYSVSNPYSVAMNANVTANGVSQDAGALAASFDSATAAATAANGLVTITVH